MKYNEAIEKLTSRENFYIDLSLDRIKSALEILGDPQEKLKYIHVAGTNGKGSTCAMLDSILREAGYKVGLYTSPHIFEYTERIKINGQKISQQDFANLVEEVSSTKIHLTEFEVLTVMMFLYFKRKDVDIVILETGMGGRFDATNVIKENLCSIITQIDLDHTERLGKTRDEIAFEKAGIIKNGRPVVAGEMDAAAKKVIASRARELGSPFIDAEVSISFRTTKAGKRLLAFESSNRSISSIAFPLLGAYQGENLATAITALETFCEVTALPIDDNAFKTGLKSVVWPCRFQVVSDNPTIIVDGAHNPPAARALVSSVAKLECPVALVAGFCDDKDCLEALKCLKPAFHAAWATLTPSPRSLAAAELASRMRIAGFTDPASCDDWHRALEDASKWAAANNGAVVVCGSLFLAGAVANFYNALPWSGGAVIPAELLKPCSVFHCSCNCSYTAVLLCKACKFMSENCRKTFIGRNFRISCLYVKA